LTKPLKTEKLGYYVLHSRNPSPAWQSHPGRDLSGPWLIHMTRPKIDPKIVDQLAEGSLVIDNAADFKKLIEAFPDRPEVHRAYGDFLFRKKKFFEAGIAFRKAGALFLETGQTLQAIAANLNKWEIVKPLSREMRALYLAIHKRDSHFNAVAECCGKMSYPEMHAILRAVRIQQLAAEEVFLSPDDPDSKFCFVVSGRVEITPEQKKEESRICEANDFFGQVYPFEKEGRFGATCKAIFPTELIIIDRMDLMTICGNYPDVETGLRNLLADTEMPPEEKPSVYNRKTSRQSLKITLGVEIYPAEPGRSPYIFKGYTSDISLGGVRLVIDPKYRDLPAGGLLGRIAKLRISLPDESVGLNIFGTLAWRRNSELDGEPTTVLGIKFNEMPPRLRGLLIVFANTIGQMTASQNRDLNP